MLMTSPKSISIETFFSAFLFTPKQNQKENDENKTTTTTTRAEEKKTCATES